MKTIAQVAIVWAVCAVSIHGQGGMQPKPFTPKAAPEQPIPFAHRTHVVTAGIKCLDCHTIRAPGDAAGFPAESVCMGCHVSIRKDTASIEKLATFAAQKKAIPWVRVYRLPRTVYFSHE